AKIKHCYQHSLKTLRKKSKPYNQAIADASSQYGISTALIRSIITAESCFKPAVVSPQGATGLMQLMPATAKRFGIKNLTDPTNNIQAGSRYLRYLLDLYQGNVLSTIAAYNAGEGAVRRFKGETPSYKETKTYVKRVMSLYDKFYHAYQQQSN
ncbi:MAG TPA: lytic transglycosylase domain-containing protein, partial [Leucothrix mucor]|nr:lytic transglycosylase domain-containing protein [Leucothrix mucor]